MKKIVFQNLSITVISKMLSFISFIYIAKVLSKSEYGLFVYISMILSLLPLFQFGSMHGTIILLPKYIAKQNDSDDRLFWSYNAFSHLIQLVSALVLFFFDIELSFYVLLIITVNYILSKYSENIQILLSSNLELEKANIIKAIDQIARPIVTLGLFFYYQNIESLFVAQMIVTLLIFLISNYFVKFRFYKFEFMEFKGIIKTIYKIGFFIYLIWVVDILFRTADKWFISQFYSISELAEYGFTSSMAMNVWLLAMSFFAPYAQMLYKYIAENRFVDVKKIVEDTNKKLYFLLLLVSTVAVVAYPFVLELVIKKYFGTELLFFVLVISAVFLSINNMYIYYMISNNFHVVLLKYQLVVLVLNLILNGAFAFLHLDIVYYSYSTILSLGLYFILVRRYFYIDIEKKLRIKTI
ncbi:MAG: hypothetical protein KN64_00625 [Sulfurovum sp. AS07-7]|nr:MAG: hypothetical protein KN64_00625 [Sulfurovum sp. AS07-7]